MFWRIRNIWVYERSICQGIWQEEQQWDIGINNHFLDINGKPLYNKQRTNSTLLSDVSSKVYGLKETEA